MLWFIEERCVITFLSDQTFTGCAIKWAKNPRLALEEDMSRIWGVENLSYSITAVNTSEDFNT